MKYSKQPFTPIEHIDLLRRRNLKISDPDRAIRYLNNIGYYRLTGYMYHFQNVGGNHYFQDNVDFNDVIQHYKFDQKLRIIISQYLQRIEVLLRSKLTNYYSINHGFLWYLEKERYKDIDVFNYVVAEIKTSFDKNNTQFIKSFSLKYTDEHYPPSNMALELLSFGTLVRLYSGLDNKDEKQRIAREFNLPSTILSSWLIFLNEIRNICAHHSRLWNRRITTHMFSVPNREKHKFKGSVTKDFNNTIYGTISIIERLLTSFNPTNSFTLKVEDLLIEYNNVNTSFMGFPEDWNEKAPWK